MRVNKVTFWLVLAAVLLIAWTAFFGFLGIPGANKMRFGIDIRGGVDAVFQPVDLNRAPTVDELESARAIIETRLDQKNILDREVTIDSTNGDIIVRFPWKSDETDFNPQKAIAELGESATKLAKFWLMARTSPEASSKKTPKPVSMKYR